MARLEILEYPNPNLKIVATPVTAFNSELEAITSDMLETMYANDGCGLAATQVDIHQRIFVMDMSETKDQPMIIINPQIVNPTGEVQFNEGCLSFPGIRVKVKRHASLELQYQNLAGEPKTMAADGILAICIQHENDHIDGITFFDRLSPLKRKLAKQRYVKANG